MRKMARRTLLILTGTSNGECRWPNIETLLHGDFSHKFLKYAYLRIVNRTFELNTRIWSNTRILAVFGPNTRI